VSLINCIPEYTCVLGRKRGVSAAILSGNEGVESTGSGERPVSTQQVQLAVYIPWSHCWSWKWREKFIQPPLSDTVAAVAVDEAHCVSKW